jgi:hypothetical protein
VKVGRKLELTERGKLVYSKPKLRATADHFGLTEAEHTLRCLIPGKYDTSRIRRHDRVERRADHGLKACLARRELQKRLLQRAIGLLEVSALASSFEQPWKSALVANASALVANASALVVNASALVVNASALVIEIPLGSPMRGCGRFRIARFVGPRETSRAFARQEGVVWCLAIARRHKLWRADAPYRKGSRL